MLPEQNRQTNQNTSDHPQQQHAAANLARHQINNIYNSQSNHAAEPFDWQTYHSAWQHYYQQYYQRYYWQQIHEERQRLASEAADKAITENMSQMMVGAAPDAPTQNKVSEFKKSIRAKVAANASKIKSSHLFVPIISALAVALIVIFLQFNSVVVAQIQSYISPGDISSSAITVDPTANVNVGPESKLIIPKINVEVPVDYSITTDNEQQIQLSLRNGAVHYVLPGANAVPGQNGNTVILGHSSNDIFNQGAYKFVFVLLDRLQVGDVFYLHYGGTRYIYKVTSTKIISPTDISALQVGTSKPMATLITCTPPGTALQRLLVFSDQISPDPSGAKTASAQEPSQATNTIAGNEPTLLDQIWQFFFK